MSADGATRPPDWKDLYQLAARELDPAKLRHRITEARDATLDRVEDSLTKHGDYKEHQELTDALNGLRVLRQEYEHRVRQYGEPPQKKG
jgi:hypothetical protein